MTKMRTVATRACAAIAAAVGLFCASSAHATLIYGINSTLEQRLITFDSETPGKIITGFAVTGLDSAERLIDLDFRYSSNFNVNQNLYAVGSSGAIYTLDLSSGAATRVSDIGAQLNGTEFGINFNASVDRLRVVSNLEQNLRVNVDTGAASVDGMLHYDNPQIDPNIVGVAYSFPSAPGVAGAVLFGIDSVANTLIRFTDPNGGALQTIGSLGVDPTSILGFDINSDGSAYASMRLAGTNFSQLFQIDLGTGLATPKGAIGIAEDEGEIRGITMQVPEVVPEPASLALLAMGAPLLLARRRRA